MLTIDYGRIAEILTHIRDNMVGESPYFYLCDCLSYLQYPNYRDFESENLILITQIEGNLTKSLMLTYSTKFGAENWWNTSYFKYNFEEFPHRLWIVIDTKKLWLTDVINDITKNKA